MGSNFVVSKSRIGKVQAWIERLSATIAATIILAMMLLTVSDVVGRFFFNKPIVGTIEIAEFMLVAIAFLSVSYVQFLRAHIIMDVATSWLPRRTQVGLDIFGHIVCLLIYSIITWKSAMLAHYSWFVHDFTFGAVELPTWPAMGIIPLGMGLLCLRLISDIWQDSANWLALGRQSSGRNHGGS